MSNIRPLKLYQLDLESGDDLPARQDFCFPTTDSGHKTYLCGHSLGLMPKNSRSLTNEILDYWEQWGVEGHFSGPNPWLSYLDMITEDMSSIVGGKTSEVCILNTLTVNIHLLLSGFYRPKGTRYKILMEDPCFPSDLYAVQSFLNLLGNKADSLLFWKENPETGQFELEDLENLIRENIDDLCLLFLGGVNYLSGQALDIFRLSSIAHKYGLLIGLDLAHAAGNLQLNLHEWDVDFACWCTYKYLNGGPGSTGAIFIHEKHFSRHDHFQGWWGNDLGSRFQMLPEFHPSEGARSWQLSNPTILALPPLKASLGIFTRFGMPKLRAKSKNLTSFLFANLKAMDSDVFRILTPENSEDRGAMITLQFKEKSQEIFDHLIGEGIIVDFRRPDIIRIAANPLYNNFNDAYQFLEELKNGISKAGVTS